ncbi:hypothetical protein ACHAWU_006916 [Discostella pseudostelligera]|uniref:E2F-associated phosphoprotein n=1 Tax=Discostella pseudostelligera TaxID=259834 RepID=A0ABD3MY21_9STRA
MDIEEYDLVAAAAVVHDDAAVIVSETDAAEAHSHSSSSSSSADEADFGEEECGEHSSWLSSSSTSMQRLHQHRNDDESSNDNNSDDDDGNDSEIMKDETAAAGSYQDDLYCENMDDEDEAWVYQHMRSGGGIGSGREELLNSRHLYHLQKQSGVEGCTEQYENHHHSKKRKGIDNKTSQAQDTDDIGSAESESESNNLMETNSDHQQHRQETSISSPLMQQQHHQEQQQQHAPPSTTMTLVKPRSSDAILSCPSCFNIVCMDCQQHEKYANQYRAMFVMNIGVDWNRKMVYDDAVGSLKLVASDGTSGTCDNTDALIARDALSGNRMGEEDMVENDLHMQLLGEGVDPERANSHHPDKVPEEHHDASASSSNHDTKENKNDESESFYSVHCSYCRYEVAALDMKDEIYYFFGCIASA